jgi:hypothetical protein
LEHEPVVENPLGPERVRPAQSPGQRIPNVLELDLIEIGASGNEVRDEPLEILLLERGRT